MSAIGLTRVSTSGAPTTSTTQSSPRRWKPALLLRSAHCSNVQASQVSTRPGKSVAQRLSLSSVLQAQTLSQSMSGCSQSLQTMRLSQPVPPTSAEYPRSKRITLTPGGGSQTAQKITNYLPLPTSTTTSPGTTGMSTITTTKELTALDLRS